MEKVTKYLNLALLILLAAACLGEFVLCFIRGYSELWSTILVPSALVVAPSLPLKHASNGCIS